MKKITMFYMKECPHCRKAQQIIDELKASNPDYAALEIEKIEENEHPEIAGEYDYFYVPTFFVDGNKLFEGKPTEAAIASVLQAALS